jgi:hypothetical protein
MTASWNADALVNCKANNYAGGWSLFGTQQLYYDSIIRSLTDSGWQVTVFPYDWRKPVTQTEQLLKTLINRITPDGKVDIVGHSMGGLLGRAYIEESKENNKVEKFMSVGSPHTGTLLAYPAWSGGEIPKGSPAWRFMLTLIEKRCALKTHNDRLTLQKYFPGLQNLLPTFDYLTDSATKIIKPVTTMNVQNNWLPTSFQSPFYGTIVGTLSGTGQQTAMGFRTKPPKGSDVTAGNWTDGKPISTNTTTDGDGIVLASSAALPGADNRTVTGTHLGIISSNQGISQIKNFLNDTAEPAALKLSEMPAITSTVYIVADPADFRLVDPRGTITKSTDGIITLTNSKSQDYTLYIFPKSNNTTLIISQELGDTFYYKEYTLKNLLPKVKFIKFDAKHPKEDILK